MKKNVLVTGGTGFIGSHLKEYLKDKFNLFVPFQKELDLLDAKKVEEYISRNKIKVIVNCAAYGVYSRNDPKIVPNNLRMFFNLVRNLHKLEKIIQLGSGAEYDRSRPIIKIKEKEFDKRVPEDGYGFYKYICSKYAELNNKIINLRLFGIYGEGDADFKFIPTAIKNNILKKEIVIKQNIKLDYLFIKDLLPIIEYFIQHKPKFKSYNVASGKTIDLIKICRLINEISDYQSKIIVLRKGLNNEFTANIDRLKKEIPSLKITDYKQGIEKVFNYYKRKYKR